MTSKQKVWSTGVLLALAIAALTRLVLAGAADACDAPAPIAWMHDEAQALELSHGIGKPLLIDFRAEWCAACKMLDAFTWADPAVRTEVAARFVPLQLDMTNEDAAANRMAERYGVSELPTVLAGSRRVTGFVRPAEMLAVLRGEDDVPAARETNRRARRNAVERSQRTTPQH